MSGPPATELPRRVVAVMAIACGAAIANTYYGQPLLGAIADTFGVSATTAGIIVVASQLGYAAGLVLVVPLGDLVERRRLVLTLLVATTAGLACTAAAPSLAVLAAALALVGVTTVVTQVLTPLAASLAGEHERGRVVGIVMSGLLIGILVARTASGLIAELAGWRAVYVLAMATMLVLTVLLARTLPRSHPEPSSHTYPTLLRSVAGIVASSAHLRRRMVYGATIMGGFSVLWTALTLLLTAPPYSYSAGTIGLFGLFGLAGALSAQGAGRIGDRGHGHAATGAFLTAIVAGWALLAFGGTSLGALIAGIIVLDLGIQGTHILNQHVIYGAHPDSRSRVTTAYMTCNYVCGALGSAAAVVAFDAGGWDAVVALGGAIAALALLAWLQEVVAQRMTA